MGKCQRDQRKIQTPTRLLGNAKGLNAMKGIPWRRSQMSGFELLSDVKEALVCRPSRHT